MCHVEDADLIGTGGVTARGQCERKAFGGSTIVFPVQQIFNRDQLQA